MKNKHIIFLSFAAISQLFAITPVFSQSPVTGILYTYDAAGNRVRRELAPDIIERKGNTNPGTAEKQRTPEVVTQNNIVASFTPNPTFTGNFAVVVNRSDFASTDNKNMSDNKSVGELVHPQIFVYNSLGELIHQESTPFNSQVYITLSKEAKGIYIVKVQSGEDVLMHRMAYQ